MNLSSYFFIYADENSHLLGEKNCLDTFCYWIASHCVCELELFYYAETDDKMHLSYYYFVMWHQRYHDALSSLVFPKNFHIGKILILKNSFDFVDKNHYHMSNYQNSVIWKVSVLNKTNVT